MSRLACRLCAHAAEVSAPARRHPLPACGVARGAPEGATALFRDGCGSPRRATPQKRSPTSSGHSDEGGRRPAVTTRSAPPRGARATSAAPSQSKGAAASSRRADGDLVANTKQSAKADHGPNRSRAAQRAVLLAEGDLGSRAACWRERAPHVRVRGRTRQSDRRPSRAACARPDGSVSSVRCCSPPLHRGRVRDPANGAIVVADSVTAKSAVRCGGVDLFVLHEGAEVRVLDESADAVARRSAVRAEGLGDDVGAHEARTSRPPFPLGG